MGDLKLGLRIKESREACGKTLLDIASEVGVHKSTIQRYERGEIEKIKLPVVESIANACGVNPLWLIGKSEDRHVVSATPNRPDDISDILLLLNEQGLNEFVKYGRYLTSQSEFQARNGELKKKIRTIRDYRTPAAAGYASPIEGEDYEDVPVDEKTPRGADFAVHIQGDSMEPYIRDGDRVFVQRDVSLTDGDVGVFFVDGDVFCKQICMDNYRNIYLLSANPKREDANLTIRYDSASSFFCFGKVILPRRLPMPLYD